MKRGFWIAAALCAALGAFFAFGYTPMRFSGYLLFAAAAVLLCLGLLWRLGKKYRWARVCKAILLAGIAAGMILFAALETWVISWARTDNDTAVAAVVVLGAGVNGTVPSLSLEVRLEAALDYIADKPDIPIVVTGSQGPGEEISEAQCMADWLIQHGVAADRILLEDQADNTKENIEYSSAVLRDNGVDVTSNIAVVTSDYHLCRSHLLWGVPWMVPVAAHMPEAYWPLTVNYFIREAFAVAAQMLLP